MQVSVKSLSCLLSLQGHTPRTELGLAGALRTQGESRNCFFFIPKILLCYRCCITFTTAFLWQVGNLSKSVLTVRQATNTGWSLILSASFWMSLCFDFNLLYESCQTHTHLQVHAHTPSYPQCCTLRVAVSAGFIADPHHDLFLVCSSPQLCCRWKILKHNEKNQ